MSATINVFDEETKVTFTGSVIRTEIPALVVSEIPYSVNVTQDLSVSSTSALNESQQHLNE